MTKKVSFIASIFFIFFCFNTVFAQCNESQKAAARKTLNDFKEILNCEYDNRTNILYVDIKEGWHSMDIDMKHKILRAIADSDACIHGEARHIYINAWGEKVAEATPKGFKVFK